MYRDDRRRFRPSRHRLVGVRLVLLAGVACLGSPALAQDQPAQGERSGQLEEIVVTAQKKQQNMQVVPVAVTAISAQTLEDFHVENASNLSGLIPNVQVYVAGEGASTAEYFIRGIGGSSSTNGQDNKVAFYIDGVYIPRATGALADVADIQRVEVLRGPQGTLYGESATGGAINMITVEPKGEFSARQNFSFGNYGEFRSKTRIDTPTWNGLSAEFTYFHEGSDGWEGNLSGGQTWDLGPGTGGHFGVLTTPSEFGYADVNAYHVSVKWDTPVDGLKVIFRGDHTDDHSMQPAIQLLFPETIGTAIYAVQPPGTRAPFAAHALDAIAGPTDFPDDNQVWGGNVTITYDPTGWLNIKDIAAIRWAHDRTSTELGGGGELVCGIPTFCSGAIFGGRLSNPVNSPITLFSSIIDTASRTESNEFTASAKTELVDVLGGVYYFHEGVNGAGNNFGPFYPPGFGVFQIVNGIPTLPGFRGANGTVGRNDNTDFAIYGQATVHITDQIDLQGGVRWSKDDRDDVVTTVFPPVTFNNTLYRVDWMADVTWRPVDGVMVYAKIATGFVPGGVFGTAPFGPEKLTEPEVGVKADLFGEKLRTNTAVFWGDYRQRQLLAANPTIQISNIGSDEIYGIEEELTYVPIEGLELDANAGWTHMACTRTPAACQSANNTQISDARVVAVPKWNMSLTAEYDTPDFDFGGHGRFRVDGIYMSDQNWFAFPPSTPAQQAAITTKGSWIINLRAGIVDFPVGQTGVTADVSLFGMNVADNRKLNFAFSVGDAAVGTFTPPAMWGVDIALKY
ncbi:MAG TPA: TonB-dependent receptor [Alphaproteobacteria bacterium]|nr:TonB-dependent receptor [Alphaproteobacteria bacterium]